MTITAHTGPVVVPRSGGFGQPAGSNPEEGPSAFLMGTLLLDPRDVYTYNPGQDLGKATYGWMTSGVVLDAVPSALAAGNISASASPGAGAIVLVSSNGAGITTGVSITRADTGAAVTGLLAIDGASGGLPFGTAGTINIWDPTKLIARNIRITSGGNDSGITFTVNGFDVYNFPMTEAITGANAGIAAGKKAFKYISSITHTGSVAGTLAVGTGDVYGLPLRADRMPYLEAWWGNPIGQITGAGGSVVPAEQTYSYPVTNTTIANGTVYSVQIPFDFTVLRAAYVVDIPVTTGSKLATVTVGINGTAFGSGGVISLTSAAMTPAGAEVGATAISGTGITSPSSQSVVTTPIASPGLVQWPNHGLVAGTPVVFAGAGLPTGLTAGTIYYVIATGLATSAFEVAATVGGAGINFTGTSTGTQTATAINAVTFTVSAVTAFSEGAGHFEVTVVNNSIGGGTFLSADTTSPATTTTGDVRGTIAMPDNSDGSKRLYIAMQLPAANLSTTTGLVGVTQT